MKKPYFVVACGFHEWAPNCNTFCGALGDAVYDQSPERIKRAKEDLAIFLEVMELEQREGMHVFMMPFALKAADGPALDVVDDPARTVAIIRDEKIIRLFFVDDVSRFADQWNKANCYRKEHFASAMTCRPLPPGRWIQGQHFVEYQAD